MGADVQDAGTERGNPQRALLGLGALPLVEMVVLVVGAATGVRGVKLAMLLVAVTTALLAFVPVIVDQARPPGQRHVLIDMLAIMFTAYFVVPVFSQYLFETQPIDPAGMGGAGIVSRDIVAGQLMALLGLASLLVGYAIPLGRGIAGLLPAPLYEWKEVPALTAACVWTGLGWLVYGLGQLGLLPVWLGTGVTGGIADASVFGAALFMTIYVRYRTRISLLFVAWLVVVTTFFNFFTGSKMRVLSPAAMIVLTWIVITGRIRIRWVVLGVLSLVLLFPLSQFYRIVVSEGRTKSAIDILRDPGRAFQSMGRFLAERELGEYMSEGLEATGHRMDALGRTSVIVRDTPSRVPFQNGRTVALVFVAYIPRVVWPGKPGINIGHWITENYGAGAQSTTATGPSWIGELYLNFGAAGVAIGMGVIGAILRVWHELFFRRGGTVLAITAGIIVLFGLMTSVGGGLVGMINSPVFAIVPLVVLHMAVRFMGGTYRWDKGLGGPASAGPGELPGGTLPGPGALPSSRP